ncbi:MAG: phosphoribosylanthranilate isomerase [Terriglobales bacterium]
MVWVKICGTTNLEGAQVAVDAGADALGFIFAQSPRRISPSEAKEIIAALPQKVETVGVFVNQKSEVILQTAKKAGLTGVQLHGDETLEFAHELRDGARAAGIKLRIYKAVAMKRLTAGDLDLSSPKNLISAFLLDSGSWTKRGGTGKKFDWEQAAPMVSFMSRRFDLIIAGGLNPENVAKAIGLFRPWGVDVVSGVEREPGKRDPEKVRAFVKAAKGVDL